MPEKKVGKVPLGCFEVDLYLDCKLAGGTCSMTDRKVVVGLAMEEWPDCVSVVMHEAMEYAMADLQLRFLPCWSASQANDDYTFHMTHPQFSEAMARAAMFVTKALPIIAAAWNKLHKKRRQ